MKAVYSLKLIADLVKITKQVDVSKKGCGTVFHVCFFIFLNLYLTQHVQLVHCMNEALD